MNNTFFSFKRFWLLLHNDLIINYKSYLLTIAGVFIVGFLFIYIQLPSEKVYIKAIGSGNWNNQYVFGNTRLITVFIISLFALAGFVGLAFPSLDNKVNTCGYLLTPSSVIEKILVQLFIRIIVGTALFLLIFWLDAYLARFAALSSYQGDSTHAIAKFQFARIFDDLSTKSKLRMIIWILNAGIYLFYSRVFFRKYGFLKGIISIPFLLTIVNGIMIFASHIFFPTETIGMSVYWDGINSTIGIARSYDLDILAISLIGIVLLPLGYYKLKEKQL